MSLRGEARRAFVEEGCAGDAALRREVEAALGDDALTSVGAYQLEGLGAQLFSRVDGDYFTILGLPLLPLLDFLRNHGVVAT